eukprot:323041-Pyramimonas_sp.AAC.1
MSVLRETRTVARVALGVALCGGGVHSVHPPRVRARGGGVEAGMAGIPVGVEAGLAGIPAFGAGRLRGGAGGVPAAATFIGP